MASHPGALFPETSARGLSLDATLRRQGIDPIIGVDEAGRGPLAGPVTAAAAWLARGIRLPGLDDSKRLSPGARETLHGRLVALRGSRVCFGVGSATAAEIDRLGIRPSTFLAMRRALADLEASVTASEPRHPLADATLVVDGRDRIPGLRERPQIAVVGGDGRSRSVAAASILAKVTRDAEMCRWARRFPAYGFEQHKGYGTRAHLHALRRHGPCPIHRRSFSPVRSADGESGR